MSAELIKKIQNIISDTLKASKPCDIRYATISSVEPLSITLQDVQLTISEPNVSVLERLKELSIDDVKHNHQYYDSDTGEGASGSTTRTSEDSLINIQCYLETKPLGKNKEGRIIIRKGLEVNDKVAVIRANGGQDYLIIGRI